jgi:aspartyl/asparaginyl beta-hydroxylase (cupin superfamily)
MRLKAGTSIKKHTDKVDKEIKNGNIVRIHIPIRTSINVHFYLWEGKQQHHYNLETGKYYYTDVSKPHAVHNKWVEDRLHLVVDCYNNPKIKDLLEQ